MAETAKTLIGDILGELLNSSPEQFMDPVEFQTALRYLNRWMLAQDADGVKLGYTEVTGPDDVITVPAGAINGIIPNIVMQLSTSYDVVVTPELAIRATDGLDLMIKLGDQVVGSKYTSNTPIGSGTYSQNLADFNFYSGCCEDSAGTCEAT